MNNLMSSILHTLAILLWRVHDRRRIWEGVKDGKRRSGTGAKDVNG